MTQADKLQELKKQLTIELQKDNSDNNNILLLSNEIAKLDKSVLRFTVDAGIINRLGKELVGRQETAVSELVKNAFDADATKVDLIFENAKEIGGTLIIEDNGLGMTKAQLVDGFMRLSSADKIHNPVSERYFRTRAGKKGIGRFATQRLGTSLTIITQTLHDEHAIKVKIEWDHFETDKNLLIINNHFEEIEKTKEEGTILIIEGLRESWSDIMIKRVYKYTSELIQPFPLSKPHQDKDKKRSDPGFKSYYFRKDRNEEKTPIIDEEQAIFNQALAEIEGYILDDGQGCWALKSDKLDFPQEVFHIGKERDDPESKYQFVKNIHFKCYYFIYEPSLFSPTTFTFIRDLANEKGGIRLYRNGFRVSPYGEKGNDWLGLDESTRRRAIIVPHQNISFFGFVELAGSAADLFEETSSREGVVENDAFHELTNFIYRSISSAVIKVAELRGRKGTASQKDWKKENQLPSPSEEVDNAISDLDELLENEQTYSEDGTPKDKEKYKQVVQKIKESREKEREQNEEERKRMIDEINMLRILAGLGLVIGEFVHEVKRFLPAFDADIVFLKQLLNEHEEGIKRANRLDNNLKSFTAYTAYFDKAISQNVLRELMPLDLIDVINDFEEVISDDIRRVNIRFDNPVYHDYNLITVPMHPSEWASILFNLYTNSKKAIKRKRVNGKIQIESGSFENMVYLEFSDNGDGIPKENENLIFNAFFTTSSAAGNGTNENDSLVGTGLGLKIIKDIIESYGGKIYVKTAKQDYSTTIRIEIPKNKAS